MLVLKVEVEVEVEAEVEAALDADPAREDHSPNEALTTCEGGL